MHVAPESGIQTREEQGLRVVELHWRIAGSWIYLASLVAFMVSLGTVVLTRGQFGASHKFLMMVAFIGLSYVLATRLFNVTRMSVSDEMFTVEHGPLPIGKSLVIETKEIRRFHTHGRRLHMVSSDGQEHVLVGRLSPTQASAIVTTLKDHLQLGSSHAGEAKAAEPSGDDDDAHS